MDFSPEDKQRAAETLWHRAWDHEEPQYQPNKKRWVTNLLAGILPALSTRDTIHLVCQLNAAVELLKSCHSPAPWHAEQVNDFLADFPEVEGSHE